jgi:hypothetical protein
MVPAFAYLELRPVGHPSLSEESMKWKECMTQTDFLSQCLRSTVMKSQMMGSDQWPEAVQEGEQAHDLKAC